MEDITRQEIESLVSGNDVVLFMKGTADAPMCGFSALVADVLGRMDVTYKDVNVLADNNLREGIKEFTNWPTIPQLYVKGEFIGGCDIIKEMAMEGELLPLFESKGVPAKALS